MSLGRCFICNHAFVGDKAFGHLFDQRLDVSGKEQNTLAAIMGLVLGHKLQEEQLHSPYVCSTCMVSLINYEDLARQLVKLRMEIIGMHQKTIKLVAANVKEEVDVEAYLDGQEAKDEACLEEDLGNDPMMEEACDTNLSAEDLLAEAELDKEETGGFEDNLDLIECCSNISDLIERCSVDTDFLNDTDDNSNGVPVLETSSDATNQSIQGSSNSQGLGRRRASQAKFTCLYCGKVCSRRALLLEHERVHTGERPFKCDLCPASFAQRANLRTHTKATHLKVSSFKCQLCDREFKRRRLLDNHIKSMHTKQRDFSCEQCGATFGNAVYLKKHQMVHTNVKNYSCKICGKKFSRAENRDIHLFVHSIRKPYVCSVCDVGFMRRQKLVQHSQVSKHDNPKIVRQKPVFSAANSDKMLQQRNEAQKLKETAVPKL